VKRKGKISKLLSVVVSAAMALSCFSGVAFADPDTSSTTTAVQHTWSLYQIATGDYTTGTSGSDGLSNLKWGTSANEYNSTEGADNTISSDDVKTIEGLTGTFSEKLDTLKTFVNFDNPMKSGDSNQPTYSQSDNRYTYTNLPVGYYLIKDACASHANSAASLHIVQIVYGNLGSDGKRTTTGSLTFEPKGSAPTVDKKIQESASDSATNKTEKSHNEASIGDTIDYVIKGTVSSQIQNYKTYYYEFSDTLDAGLTPVPSSLSVKVKYETGTTNVFNEVDVTKYFYNNMPTTETDTNTATNLTVSIDDLKKLQNLEESDGAGLGSIVLGENTQIIVSYKAKLNQYAVTKDANKNAVKVIYSNDPNVTATPSTEKPPENPSTSPEKPDVTGTTPTSTTRTYTTAIVVTKISRDGATLTGAEFSLTGKDVKNVVVSTGEEFTEDTNGTYYKLTDDTYTETAPTDETVNQYTKVDDTYTKYTKSFKTELLTSTPGDSDQYTVVGTVDDHGQVLFYGLGAGDYVLKETKAPAGYGYMEDVSFQIQFHSDNENSTTGGMFSSTRANMNFDMNTGMFNVSCIDSPASALPTTGGIGTTIFYTVGTLLVLGAGIALVVRRRMRKEEGQI
jgi:fimbrial isopeptide formation D2 family protein/LPXTG-motif cell wall-anchored protein